MEKEEKEEYYILLNKFFAGEIADSEMIRLKKWLDEDPENHRIFDRENALWQELNLRRNREHFNMDSAWENIYLRV